MCSVPPQWTDIAAPDPEVLIGGYRALMRVADFMELERLVDNLRKPDSWKKPTMRKAKYAANVSETVPLFNAVIWLKPLIPKY